MDGGSEGQGSRVGGWGRSTFPATHLQEAWLPDLQEEVLVLLVLFIVNDVDLNRFTEIKRTLADKNTTLTPPPPP